MPYDLRQRRGATFLDALQQDVQYAVRGLSRTRAITAAAVLTLAIGIAATTVMFAVVRGVLLRPLPVLDQDRLVVAWSENPTSGSTQFPFGDAAIEVVRDSSRLIESAAGVTRNGVARAVVTDNGFSVYANVALVTGGFFEVLGVKPHVGRALSREDEREGAEKAIVISRGFWQRRYGESRDVVGQRVLVGDVPFRIAGVMPADFDYPPGADLWRTTHSVPTDGPFGDAARREVNLIARLRPGVTLEQISAELTAMAGHLEASAPPGAPRGLVPVVRPFADVVVGDVRPAILALFAAVALVLLIASANVANLLLMRGEARRGEMALRAALGAGRTRLVRQVLAESFVVAALSGVAGVLVAWWGLRAVVRLVPDGLPRVDAIQVDGMVVMFSVGIALAAALIAGVTPAVMSSRADLTTPLREGGRTVAGGRSGGRRTLVVAQVALAVTVVGAAGLLVRSVLRLQSVDLGLSPERLVLLDLYIPPARYAERAQRAQLLDDVNAQLLALPAISAATPVNVPPFGDRGWDVPRFTAEGQGDGDVAANPSLNLESIHPNYFETLEVPIVEGRAFTEADREGAPAAAIISQDVAARVWPDRSAVGARLKMGAPSSPAGWYTIVGVAASTRYRTLTAPRPTLYLPAAQFQMTATMFVVRTSAPLELVTSLAAERIQAVAPDVRVMQVRPFTDLLDRPLARPRLAAFLLGLFAFVALLLSAVGLYAVMAAHVGQRDREIALRVTLGASTAAVRRLVLAEAIWLTGIGVTLGLAGAIAAARFLRGLLFEVHPLDPASLVSAALLLALCAGVATVGPLRRATRVDAVATLRSG